MDNILQDIKDRIQNFREDKTEILQYHIQKRIKQCLLSYSEELSINDSSIIAKEIQKIKRKRKC